MESKRFTKNDNGFVCAHCGRQVEPLGYTSRNHCPYCLWSLHVDMNPGDRACECHGGLEPISVLTDPKKGYIVVHKCTKCGAIRRNKYAEDDNKELIIKLTVTEFKRY